MKCRKIKKNLMKSWIKGFLAVSCSILSLLLIVNTYYTDFNVITTMCISFIAAFYLFNRTVHDISKEIVSKPELVLVNLLFSASILTQLWIRKNCKVELMGRLYVPVNKLWFHLLALLAMVYLLFIVQVAVKRYVFWLRCRLDVTDRKIWILSTIMASLMIFMFYVSSSGWYTSAYLPPSSEYAEVADVYGMDCGGVYGLLYSDASYYDIRHPLFTVLIFPLWASVNTISKIFVPSGLRNLFNAVLLQTINAQLLILTGLHIKIATKNRNSLILYLISFPSLLYGISFEKYQICTFLISLFCVASYYESDHTKILYIVACSFMPTSAVAGISEIIKKGNKFLKVKWWLHTIILGVGTLVFFGRGHLLTDGFRELAKTAGYFTMPRIPYLNRLIATIKMIQSCFLPLSSKITGRLYTFNELYSPDCYLGITIIIVILFGFAAKRRNVWMQISFIWFGFSFILFIVLNWVPQEAPLFNIYFSWAVIPLFVEGIDWILKKNHLNKNIVWYVIAGGMVIVNIIELIQIDKFYRIMNY